MNGIPKNNADGRYIPGVCNIGKREIKKRKQAGWTGLIITVILLGMHFCAYFGMQGVFNFSPDGGL